MDSASSSPNPASSSVPRQRLPREARIRTILATAREVFEESGYEGAKVADIAARLGISEGTVYAFFASKRELMAQVIIEWYRRTITPLQEGVYRVSGTRERLRYILWQHLKTLSENAELCAVVLKESRNLGEPESPTLRELRREYTEPLMRVLAEGIECGDLRPDLSRSLTRNLVYGACEQALWDMLASGRAVDVERMADQMTAALYPGLVAPSGPPLRDGDAELARLGELIDRMESALDARARPADEGTGIPVTPGDRVRE